MHPTSNGFHPRRLSLAHDLAGRLVLDVDGARHVGVEPVRAFPLSDPTEWISLCDAEGREVVSIKSLDELDDAARAMLASELAKREFLPVIQRIVNVSVKNDPSTWSVETDRGPTTFFVEGSEAVRRLEGERCLVVDTQGVRYLIADRRKLDAYARKMLEHYL
jgi:hypothetical protein